MDLSERLGITEKQKETETIEDEVTVKVQVNTDLDNNENFADCPSEVLLDSDMEPILNEVNNYTILLKEMNQGNVQEMQKDTSELEIGEKENCAAKSEVHGDQPDITVTPVPDNNNGDVFKIVSGSEDRKFVTCSVCNMKVLRKSYKRHFVKQHVSNQLSIKNQSIGEKIQVKNSVKSQLGKVKKVCVNVEQIKIDKLKIKPEDPVKERERLTLVKDVGISYKILDSINDQEAECLTDNAKKYKIPPKIKPSKKKKAKITQPASFQCQLCQKCYPSRNNLLRHYSACHFKEKLLPFVDAKSLTCLICEKKMAAMDQSLLHVGSFHNMLEGLLPDEVDLPGKKREVSNPNLGNKCYPDEEKSENEFLCPFCEDNCYFDSQRDLYRHYSIVHYQRELQAYAGDSHTCPLCQDKRSGRNIIIHLGVDHNLVEQFIPEKNHMEKCKEKNLNESEIKSDNAEKEEIRDGDKDKEIDEQIDSKSEEKGSDLLTLVKAEESNVTLKERVKKDKDISHSTIYDTDLVINENNDNLSKDLALDSDSE